MPKSKKTPKTLRTTIKKRPRNRNFFHLDFLKLKSTLSPKKRAKKSKIFGLSKKNNQKVIKRYTKVLEKKLLEPVSFQQTLHIICLLFSNLLWATNFLIKSVASFFEFVGHTIIKSSLFCLRQLNSLNQKLTALDLSLDFYVDLDGLINRSSVKQVRPKKIEKKVSKPSKSFYLIFAQYSKTFAAFRKRLQKKFFNLVLSLKQALFKKSKKLSKKLSFLLFKILKTTFSFTLNIVLIIPKFLFRTKKRALIAATLSLGSFIFFYNFVLKDLPNPYQLKEPQNMALSTVIYDRNGEELYKIFHDKNRSLVKLEELPKHLIDATVAYEDTDFFKHHGVSIRGIVRAIRNDLFDEQLHGGSTITQQLIKNALLSNEKTIKRKAKEVVLSLMAEVLYSKKEILQMYLNEIPYGGPIYGIEEAAKTYFGKSAKDLSLAEGALLAGLPTSPTQNNPMVSPIKAKNRQKLVLTRMVENGFITQEQAEEASKEKIEFSKAAFPIKAPHFVMLIKNLLMQKYGQKITEEGGLKVYTTLDYGLQKFAEKAISDEINKIGKKYWIKNAAAMVTKPKTGEVLTMIGSKDFFDESIDGNVNITLSPRQPGSSIKVVNYSYALTHGYTPSSVLLDAPVSYKTPSGRTYSPVNYDGKFRGPVTLHDALAMSLNVPAVRVLNSYGHQKMLEQGRKMGITTWNKPDNFYGLSLTLGAGEVTMADMTVVYGCLANQGIRKNLVYLKKVIDSQGNVLEDSETGKGILTGFPSQVMAAGAEFDGQQVIHPQIAYQLTEILADVDAKSPTYGRPQFHKLYVPENVVATKTGTSNNKRDNWTFGYTPEYLVATWVGNNDNTPMNPGLASGITGAAPLWNTIMTQILKDHQNKEFPAPEGLIPVQICASNGLLPCEGCSKVKTEYFVPGTEPTKHCQVATPSATPVEPGASPPPAP